jgi:hypothetical protein
MEVNFRPLPPSNTARRAAPGQAPSSDEGQNFMEIIESLTSVENNPDGSEQTEKKKEQPKPAQQKNKIAPPAAESGAEQPGEEAQPPDQSEPKDKRIGGRLDMLA